jgi:putative ABC transport system ATP-binding protein
MIRVKDVTKVYQVGGEEVHALRGVKLNVNGGDFVAIQGPSGSGKSTLLHIIGCIDRPTSGKVHLDELEVTSLSDRRLTKIRLKKIGFIFQQFYLIPTLNASENITLPMKEAGVRRGERIKRSKGLLEKLDILNRATHYPSQLSGGEQQRVAIARALANNPRLLLADEPTGELDSKNSQKIVDILKSLNRDEGITIVMVSHDDTVARQATRTVKMKDGKVARK